MVRPRRIEFPGAVYHIMARGNRKSPIFHSGKDYKKYLSLLEKYYNKFHFIIYAFAIIPNHVHLLIQTPFAPASKIMQGLQESYTLYYNRKYKTVGHVFQGRFKAKICRNMKYFIQLIKYIHINSVEAKLTDNIDEYPWCSHIAYSDNFKKFGFLDTNILMSILDTSNRADFLITYKSMMQDALVLDQAAWKELLDSNSFEEKFIDSELFKVDKFKTRFSRFEKININRTKLIRNLAKTFDTSSGAFLAKSKNKKISTIKCFVNYHLIYEVGFSIADTSRFWGQAKTTVASQIRNAELTIGESKKTYEIIREIIEKSIS